MRLSVPCLTLLVLAACRPTLPSPAMSRVGTPVEASFGKTWDATIDAFADRAVSIETLDRSSGLIVPAGRSFRPGRDALESLAYADCGKSALGQVIYPLTVKYNVVVRGDSTRSTVLVRAFYRSDEEVVCSSKGLFERGSEEAIKSRAERR